jgi:hypothetical protein
VAEDEQENGREPLTKREREVIRELAREIVREAGGFVGCDDASRHVQLAMEPWKMRADYFKHLSTVSGATVIAVVAVAGYLGAATSALRAPVLMYVAVLGLLFSTFLSLAVVHQAIRVAASIAKGSGSEDEEIRARKKQFFRDRQIALFSYTAGLISFAIFVYSNVKLPALPF